MSSDHSQSDFETNQPSTEELFGEFRRKVRDSELLSGSTVKVLRSVKYTGKVSVILQNGEVIKSGYEEGYFRRKGDLSF